jgi:hypothetical protein
MADYFLQDELVNASIATGVETQLEAYLRLVEIKSSIESQHPLPPEPLDPPERLPPKIIVFDIFLSYSSKDSLAVLGLYRWLQVQKYRVYLDCFDPALPNPSSVTRQTAQILRRRMVQCLSLFVATTNNTPSSDWVPWELGFTDGLTNKSAVLYIAPQANVRFNRQSYFELYPEVQRDNTQSKPLDLLIFDPPVIPAPGYDWQTWLNSARRY